MIALQVRRNINTLEYPIWIPSRLYSKQKVYENENYILRSGSYPLPTAFDIDLLMQLLAVAQANNTKVVDFDTMYSMCNTLNLSKSMINNMYIRYSLDKWQASFIKYKESFWKNGKYEDTGDISIITFKRVDKSPIKIEFTEDFYNLNSDKYSLSLDLDTYLKLKHPLAKRIYEILFKSFANDEEFKIGMRKFIEKVPILNVYGYKKIERKIEKSLQVINSIIQDKTNSFYNVAFTKSRNTDELVCNFVQLKIEE